MNKLHIALTCALLAVLGPNSNRVATYKVESIGVDSNSLAILEKFNTIDGRWEEVYVSDILYENDIVRCRSNGKPAVCELHDKKNKKVVTGFWKDSTEVSNIIHKILPKKPEIPGAIFMGEDIRIKLVNYFFTHNQYKNDDPEVYAVKEDNVINVINTKTADVVCSLISVKDSQITDVRNYVVNKNCCASISIDSASCILCFIELYDKQYVDFLGLRGNKLIFGDISSFNNKYVDRFDFIYKYGGEE